eukprot:gene23075-10910_t
MSAAAPGASTLSTTPQDFAGLCSAAGAAAALLLAGERRVEADEWRVELQLPLHAIGR